MNDFSPSLLSTKDANREALEKSFTVFGYMLSSMAISVHVFVHFTTDLFKNFPGNLLVSNCILLFTQYIVSMVFLLMEEANHDKPAIKTYLQIYNYWITAYIWSVLTRVQFAMAFDLWKCLREQTTNARLSKNNATKFLRYSFMCWFSPFIEWFLLWIVGNFVLKNFANEENCAICSKNGVGFVFLTYYISDFFMMLLNFSLYGVCLYYIYRTKSSVKNAVRTSNFVFYFKICGRLFIMSEVNYTLLILVNYFELGWLRSVFYNFMAYHGTVVFATIVFQKSVVQYKSDKSESESTGSFSVTSLKTPRNMPRR